MNAPKSLAATVAALSIAGAIGLAYAQSTPDAASPQAPATTPTPTEMQQPTSPAVQTPADAQAPGSTGTTPSGTVDTAPSDARMSQPSPTGDLPAERAPRADRN